jgi:hypothetical protein
MMTSMPTLSVVSRFLKNPMTPSIVGRWVIENLDLAGFAYR